MTELSNWLTAFSIIFPLVAKVRKFAPQSVFATQMHLASYIIYEISETKNIAVHDFLGLEDW